MRNAEAVNACENQFCDLCCQMSVDGTHKMQLKDCKSKCHQNDLFVEEGSENSKAST